MNRPSRTNYFAYGSNLSLAQMAERCPSSMYRGHAILNGYRWQINQRGVANVVPSKGYQVEGMVFTVNPDDERALDRSEGVSRGFYEKRSLPVLLSDWKEPMKTALVARKLRLGEPMDSKEKTIRIDALVYISFTYVHDGAIREEYIARMQRATEDARNLGMSLRYASNDILPKLAGPVKEQQPPRKPAKDTQIGEAKEMQAARRDIESDSIKKSASDQRAEPFGSHSGSHPNQLKEGQDDERNQKSEELPGTDATLKQENGSKSLESTAEPSDETSAKQQPTAIMDHVSRNDSTGHEALATGLTACTVTPKYDVQINQISHRLNLLDTWFGGHEGAKAALEGKTILELGCGQGDMTVALAYMVSTADSSNNSGRVIAVDPAPLTYGSPWNLGQAQTALSESKLGKHILWVQEDPIDFLKANQIQDIDFVVFAHSLFYLPSAEYYSNLLRALRAAASTKTKLLLADWGMQSTAKEAEAHVLAVKVQLEEPELDANVRTVIEPEQMEKMVEQAGWRLEHTEWIRQSNMEDGKWEVGNVRKRLDGKALTGTAKQYFDEMEKLVESNGGAVKSMDIWTSVSGVGDQL